MTPFYTGLASGVLMGAAVVVLILGMLLDYWMKGEG